MMNDTVREDLQAKISPGPMQGAKMRTALASEQGRSAARPPISPPQTINKRETEGLVAPKTSPTLVEFQNKNSSLPDWRIQLQNAVQQRKGGINEDIATGNTGSHRKKNAVSPRKPQIVGATITEAAAAENSDPRVASAMRRIAESRNAFLESETKPKRPTPPRSLGIVSPNNVAPAASAAARARSEAAPKPQLVRPPFVAEKRITNKLPPIETVEAEGAAAPVLEKDEMIASAPLPAEFPYAARIDIRAEVSPAEIFETDETESDEIEDLAPFSMRFGAGLFDFIIGGFAAMVLLSPLAFGSYDWFTTAGLLMFAGSWMSVMFVYMTACLGFYGKTMGMRLFSLELVDAVENEYPTLRQAFVNSAVFLLTAGAGFLTVFFNEERRALHDLLSGTIIVREF